MIHLSIPSLAGNEERYVLDCLRSGWISSVGSYVTRFESEFAAYVNAPAAVSTVNGTAALHLALLTTGVKANDDVFAPTLTFVASINAIRYVGAYPVFVDCCDETLGLSPEAIRAYIRDHCTIRGKSLVNRKTNRPITAMMPVHVFGHACRMDELMTIADDYNLTVIEDAAEAVGCLYRDTHAGTIGHAGCYSFNGNKLLTTGGGGMLVFRDVDCAETARHLSTQARTGDDTFGHDQIGYNYRMNNIQAAIGVAQLERVNDMIARKRAIHARYSDAFQDLDGLQLFTEQAWCRSNYWMGLVRLLRASSADFRRTMAAHDIQVRPIWQLNHTHPMYEDVPRGPTPAAEAIQQSTVCIPCHQAMSDQDVSEVITCCSRFVERNCCL